LAQEVEDDRHDARDDHHDGEVLDEVDRVHGSEIADDAGISKRRWN
jgi:hypothetical protein